MNIDHEVWSKAIILSEESGVNKELRKVDRTLPKTVADLIDKNNHDHPSWMKYLLSSQLDMDRLDYLRRDSLFTGAGYARQRDAAGDRIVVPREPRPPVKFADIPSKTA